MPVTGARGQAPLKGTCEGHMGFIVVVGEGVCVPFLREGGIVIRPCIPSVGAGCTVDKRSKPKAQEHTARVK